MRRRICDIPCNHTYFTLGALSLEFAPQSSKLDRDLDRERSNQRPQLGCLGDRSDATIDCDSDGRMTGEYGVSAAGVKTVICFCHDVPLCWRSLRILLLVEARFPCQKS